MEYTLTLEEFSLYLHELPESANLGMPSHPTKNPFARCLHAKYPDFTWSIGTASAYGFSHAGHRIRFEFPRDVLAAVVLFDYARELPPTGPVSPAQYLALYEQVEGPESGWSAWLTEKMGDM